MGFMYFIRNTAHYPSVCDNFTWDFLFSCGLNWSRARRHSYCVPIIVCLFVSVMWRLMNKAPNTTDRKMWYFWAARLYLPWFTWQLRHVHGWLDYYYLCVWQGIESFYSLIGVKMGTKVKRRRRRRHMQPNIEYTISSDGCCFTHRHETKARKCLQVYSFRGGWKNGAAHHSVNFIIIFYSWFILFSLHHVQNVHVAVLFDWLHSHRNGYIQYVVW